MKIKHRLQTFDIEVTDGQTLTEFKNAVAAATGVAESRQKLIAKGKTLDDRTWPSLKPNATIMLLEQSGGGTYGSRVAPGSGQSSSRGAQMLKTMQKARRSVTRALTPSVVLERGELEGRITAGARLGYLSLNGVNAENIPPGSFDRSLTRVELISVKNLRAELLAGWFQIPALCASLKKLVLNYCQLEDQQMLSLRGLRNLTHLELRGNRLTQLPLLDLATGLKTLDVSDNAIRSLVLGSPLELETLNITGNRIRELDLRALAMCEVVRVSGNDVCTINVDSGSTSCIQVLDVRNNPNLAKLPDGFFRDLGSLVQLEMSGTALVEKDLRHLPEYEAFKLREETRRRKTHDFVREYNLQ